MNRRTLYSLICILAAASFITVARAGDPWKDKKPADWTPKQMDKFLTSSPWAMTVQPTFTPPPMDNGPTSANTGGWGGGPGGGGGGGGRWGGGGGGGMGGAMPIMSFQVRWLSAPIMRDAMKVVESDPLNAAIAKYAPDYYIVGVTMHVEGGSGGGGQGGGKRAGGGQWGGAQWGGQNNGQAPTKEQMEAGRAQFEQMLINGSMLTFGGHSVHPVHAEMTPCKSGMTTLYLFPRSLKLETADKNYLFELVQGPFPVRASFSLKGFEQAPDKGF